MAYTSGTASNYKDLLSVLATFASANGWTILEQTTTLVSLRGEGLSGLDEIYCSIGAFENSTAGYYNWEVCGAWAWRSGRALGAHPMSSAKRYIYLWNTSIPYWMVATPRRIIMLAKISTTYQVMYLGLGDPPATEAQYPYPLIIGGCGDTAAQSYSATGTVNSAFCSNNGPNGLISRPGGDWDSIGPTTCPAVSQMYEWKASMLTDISGGYVFEPIFIVDYNRRATYAALDGIYRVSGFNNSSENIITSGEISHLAFQDVYRTSYGDYFALRLS